VCAVRRDGDLVAAFALRRRGSWLLGFTNYHSPLCRPIAIDDEALAALVDAVIALPGVDLDLEGIPSQDPSLTAFRAAAEAAGRVVYIQRAFDSPIVSTAGDYETWRQENKSRWKAPLEKKRRKMERDFDASFVELDQPADDVLEAELTDGLRIEASGWKGARGTAIESQADSASFYRLLARALRAHDELRFNWIRLDGKAISFDYCIEHRNRVYTLKSGYDEDYRSLAPGLVSRLSVIKACFEHGVEAHELLGDEVGWKTRFSSESRPYVNLRILRRNPVGLGRYIYWSRLRPRLRRLYRKVRPRDD
jgi:CelD/BcsL family acetyltransferase involved in cellulose biosynthesis